VSPVQGSTARANRLLVLDDDPFIPRWIRKVAEHEGYDVSICTDLTTIRAVHRSARPTLILMDLTLGGGYQGLEALRLLSADRCTTPIILTGAAEPGVLHSASRFGMTLDLSMAGIIPKPIELGQLRRALAAHLHEQREVSTVDVMLSTGTESPAPVTAADAASSAKASSMADDARLRQAFEADELRVYYQPQISLRTGAVVAMEALVRWQHPLRGLISPNSFLANAERADLIRSLTFFVLESALDECRGWMRAGQPVSVSVNLSTSLLHEPTLPDTVEALLERYRVPPGCLTFEVDESAAIGHVHDVLDALTRLRFKGCRLSLDNFGTGFSSLVELRNLPFSQLKIDKAYVHEARTHQAARGIVEAVIEFGHRIGLEIVAEGVEDRETLALLKDAGCDLAQGFLISRPVDAEAVSAMLGATAQPIQKTRAFGSRAN
jgi:EAL domain-containing protein (putative c-di-GMP-specific phosphodiesterase class I)/CheY-like chemotaxis protein